MLFRLYRDEDFAALYALEERCFQPPLRFGRGYMRQLLENANSATWIAEGGDGKLVGFAIVEWGEGSDGIEAYLQTIEVDLKYRGQGIGKELLRRAEASAQAADAGTLRLHVDTLNETAIRLYERHGYRREGREENYYARGRPALVYVKRLRPSQSGRD